MTVLHSRLLHQLLLVAAALLPQSVFGQGTITFDGAALFSGRSYVESGMMFQVIAPPPGGYDDIGGVPAITGPSNVPYNSTPYMVFFRYNNPLEYVSITMTNRSAFGLAAVQLADPTSPSAAPVAISFFGTTLGGLSVTNTFTTPGNGATTFANYSFDSSFGPGLTRVDISAPRWAMDNLVFTVPEPSAVALVGLVALAFAARHATRQRKP